MPTFRLKHTVAAVKWNGDLNELFDEFGTLAFVESTNLGSKDLTITTAFGEAIVHIGDWIVKGHRGTVFIRTDGEFDYDYEIDVRHQNGSANAVSVTEKVTPIRPQPAFQMDDAPYHGPLPPKPLNSAHGG
jgi:hypothetical protein